MLSKLYAILFTLFILGGMWFQRSYMASSAAELRLIEQRMASETGLLSATDFVMERYANGNRTNRVSAEHGTVLTDGQIVLRTNIWFTRYRGTAVNSRLHTQEAFGRVAFPDQRGTSRQFISDQTSLQRFHLPGEVFVYFRDGLVRTDDVIFDFPSQLLQTDSVVTFRGRAQRMRGVGLTYALETGQFSVRGRVKGLFRPASPALSREDEGENGP